METATIEYALVCPDVAVMCAWPTLRAVTVPVESTTATVLSVVVQCTGRPERSRPAPSCSSTCSATFLPGAICAAPGVMSTHLTGDGPGVCGTSTSAALSTHDASTRAAATGATARMSPRCGEATSPPKCVECPLRTSQSNTSFPSCAHSALAVSFLTHASVQSPDGCNVAHQRARGADRAASSTPRSNTSVSRSQ